VEREVRTRRGGSRIASVQTWRLLLVLLIGLAMGALSLLVNLAASALTLLRFRLADTLIQATGGRLAPALPAGPPRVQRTASGERAAPGALAAPLLAFVGLAAAYGAAAGAVVIFGAPQAAGSGLAEMRCGAAAVSPVARSSSLRWAASGASAPRRRAYFNGVHVSGLLTLRTMVAKLVSAVCVLSAGLVAEGAALLAPRGALRGARLEKEARAARARRRVPVRARGRHRGRRPGRPGVQARPPCERQCGSRSGGARCSAGARAGPSRRRPRAAGRPSCRGALGAGSVTRRCVRPGPAARAARHAAWSPALVCAHAGAPRHDRRRGGLRWTPRPPCRPCLAGARACNDALRAPPAGLAVAFVAPLAGVLLIVEQSAANLAEAVYWRALLAAAAAVLALNVLAAAYEEGPGFWDARCARARAPARPSCAAREASEGPGARRLLFTFAPSAAPALAAYRVRLWELPAFAAAGALLGAAAALCVAVNVNVVHAARQRWAPPAARFRRALGLQSRARCDRPRLSTNLRRTHHMRPAQGPRVQSLPSLHLPEGAHVTPERARGAGGWRRWCCWRRRRRACGWACATRRRARPRRRRPARPRSRRRPSPLRCSRSASTACTRSSGARAASTACTARRARRAPAQCPLPTPGLTRGRGAQLFFAPTRLTLRRATGVDASSAAGAADADTLFDPRALALCAPGPAAARTARRAPPHTRAGFAPAGMLSRRR